MLILALDTCDSRGSLAILKDSDILHVVSHSSDEDYSSWILPTASSSLSKVGARLDQVELFAVAAGPGSFTGVRVGLTTVKAWSEAYGIEIAGVSRLEAVASGLGGEEKLVASFLDAHREQVFGALFCRGEAGLELVGQEMVVRPVEFLQWVAQEAGSERVCWISMDPEKLTGLPEWRLRAEAGERVEASTSQLASAIGRIGHQRAASGRLTDALKLDAEYVRRSDAEIFWKGGGAKRGG